jgi:hypothetical protein
MVAGLVPLPTRCSTRWPSEGLPIVLDPDGGGFGSAQGVDAEEVGQRAVVHRDRLRDLEEADQLEPV